MNYRDRPWPEGGPGGHMDPYTAPGPQPRSRDVATQALARTLRLPLPHDWATFTREEIEAIQADASRQGAEQERKRIAGRILDLADSHIAVTSQELRVLVVGLGEEVDDG